MDNQEKHYMKRIALILFLVGFVSIGVGIAIPFVDSALTQPQVIHSSGYIVYPSGEPKPAENNYVFKIVLCKAMYEMMG